MARVLSKSSGARVTSFRNSVRERDGRCVITGEVAVSAYRGIWWGFEAAHIFPLAHKDFWEQGHYSRWITAPMANGDTINSVQNGMLLRNDIHALFDSYAISINPDVCILFLSFLFPLRRPQLMIPG